MASRNWFSPTDVFRIPKGVPVCHAMKDFFIDPEYREDFMAFNGISDDLVKFSEDKFFLGHHPVILHPPSHLKELFQSHRTRSLDLHLFLFSTLGMRDFISSLKRKSSVRVLEIGCGNGRALMELSMLLPEARLHGVGKFSGEDGFTGINSMKMMAPFFTPECDLSRITIDFEDINEGLLNFPERHFDLIFSRSSIRYLKRKDRILSEIPRLLSSEGRAFIDLTHFAIENCTPEEAFGESFDPATSSLCLLPGTSPEFEFLEDKSEETKWNDLLQNFQETGWKTVVRFKDGR